MKQTTFLLTLLLLIPSCILAKKDKTDNPAFCQPVYIYGIATSFNDSIAYLTDVQYLDSAYLEHDRFLGGIKDYVGQLDAYFFKQGNERISTIFFATKQKKAEKKYIKLRKKYLNPKSHMLLKPLTKQEFTFTNVRPDIDPDEMPAPKKDKKDKKHDKPQGAPDGKRPPMGGPGNGGMGGPGGGMGGPGNGGMGGPGGGMGGFGGGM